MPTVYDIPANILIRRLAQDLKSREEITAPEWMLFVKTGAHKERAPDDPDFWYVRCASILRKVYLNGPIGTEKCSGAIVRTVLQQLESAVFVKKQVTKGREMTDIGRYYLDKLSSTLKKELSQAIPELEKY